MRDSSSTYWRSSGAERAVEAEGQRAGVVQRVPEGLGGLPDSVRPEASVMVPEIITGQRRPASLEELLDGEQRRLGVERVEHRLDQQDVGAAFGQARKSASA
jgi:hypothetical protein